MMELAKAEARPNEGTAAALIRLCESDARMQALYDLDQATEFLSVVRRVSQQQDREQLASPVVESLPAAGRSENVDSVILEREPDCDPDDDEAIAEFDHENSG